MLDHHDGDVARDGAEQGSHGLPFALRQAGQRLVEQEHLRLLRKRHRELEPPPLAVGCLGHDAFGTIAEPDTLQRCARVAVEVMVAGQHGPGIPAPPVEAEKRQHHVVDEPLAREQCEDLVGAGEAEVHAPLCRHAVELGSEQPH